MAVVRLQAVLADLGSQILPSEPRSLDWPRFEALLPDGGFPRGAVVELASPRVLGGATRIALGTIRAALAKDVHAFSAWVDPYETLYAPGVARAGVDLERLLVVHPPPSDLGRIAVKVVASGAFEIAVIEMAAVSGAAVPDVSAPLAKPVRGRRPLPGEVMVRKLALLAEKEGTTVLLLSDSTLPRSLPWPVALRLELACRRCSESRKDRPRRAEATEAPDAEKPHRYELSVRVVKDRRGRIGAQETWIPLEDAGRNHEPISVLPLRKP
ncbi:MAG TPA: hypothetical protein VNO21_08370 [Polyangiaceae bacterium]|nr:hypothetical protein [Polyangiaceae bacterium]